MVYRVEVPSIFWARMKEGPLLRPFVRLSIRHPWIGLEILSSQFANEGDPAIELSSKARADTKLISLDIGSPPFCFNG